MVTTRSQENLLNIDTPANVSFTVDIGSSNTMQGDQRTPRTRTADTSQGSRRISRHQSDNMDQSHQTRTRTVADNTTNLQDNDSRIQQMISDSFQSFRGEISSYISNELRSLVQNLNVSSTIPNNSANETSSVNNPIINHNSNNHNINAIPSSRFNSDPLYADKVLNIIRNWRIKFSGHDDQMSVDEFTYRVNILTNKNLGGDFRLLIDHAHILFEGKALIWYWRYHRENIDFDWFTLTNALQKKYREDFSDFDILDDLRRRKQRPNENFDEYLDAVSTITDKLKYSISDRDLCETLIRNLKNDIRHEILHLEITSVSQLRREVKKHEKFMKDLRAMESRKFTKGRIAEMTEQDDNFQNLEMTDNETEICAVQTNIKCWNCDKLGHTYFDCMEVRRVFCYGCGVKDVYKPTFPNCSRKTQGNGLRDVRRN